MRKIKKSVQIGNKIIGNGQKILIQSMTNTRTSDVNNTVKQIKELTKYGCDIIRVAILDMDDAKAIYEIKKQISIPLVADIHFDYRLALECIKNGVDKIRLNPGNIEKIEQVKEVVEACKAKHIPIRIGVNAGSLPKDLPYSPKSMIIAAKRHIDILTSLDFHDIVLSLKCSDVNFCIEAYRLADKEFDYPLHVGITEAGLSFNGGIKSAVGIGVLLNEGIGDTIRVSLTDDPVMEIKAAKEILSCLGLRKYPVLTSCPTCGRTMYDMIPIVEKVNRYLETIDKPIHVAIMGCIVNGPGEAKNADIGVAGGNGEALLFKKGIAIRKIKEKDIVSELIKEIEEM